MDSGRRQEDLQPTLGIKEILLIIAGAIIIIVLLVMGILALANINNPDHELIDSGFVFATATPIDPAGFTDETGNGDISAESADGVEITHTVRLGDTASGIAALYEVEIEAIENANDTDIQLLQPYQELIIPLTDEHQVVYHVVQYGQALGSIASLYQVPSLLIEAANGITNPNSIFAGQRLLIIGRPSDPEIVIPSDVIQNEIAEKLGEIPPAPELPRSPLMGIIEESYPSTADGGLYTIHYQPGTYTETNLDEFEAVIDDSIDTIESVIGVSLTEPFDIYTAGTPYEDPYGNIQGLSDHENDRIFLLFDGNGSMRQQRYIIGAKMTQFITRKTWGDFSSPVFSEGLADMVGRQIAGEFNGYSNKKFCNEMFSADMLPSITELDNAWWSYESMTLSHPAYAASGCFIEYFIEEYGLDAFRTLYQNGLTVSVTSKTLAEVASDWLETLLVGSIDNPERLITTYEQYHDYASEIMRFYDGSEEFYLAYFALDRAREALWQGDLDGCSEWLTLLSDLTGYVPPIEED